MATSFDYGKRRRVQNKEDSTDVQLSKFLSYVCRHGAAEEGIKVHDGGFLNVDDVLTRSPGRRYMHTKEDVQSLVRHSENQRFTLRNDPVTGSLQIRANHGHTLQKVKVDDLELTPIMDAGGTPLVVHGTYMDAWSSIKCMGLSRMGRNHIHFSPGLPGEAGVSAKMFSSEVLIFIDLPKALADGLRFYRSVNNVILSPGNYEGIILPEYFEKVREHPSGKVMHVPLP